MCPGESDKGAARSLKRVSAHMLAAASRKEQPLDNREFQKIRLSRIFCVGKKETTVFKGLNVFLLLHRYCQGAVQKGLPWWSVVKNLLRCNRHGFDP